MAGGVNNKAAFFWAQYANSLDQTNWTNITASWNSTAPWGGRSRSGTYYYTWDTRCSS
jgi:hypothetical protein